MTHMSQFRIDPVYDAYGKGYDHAMSRMDGRDLTEQDLRDTLAALHDEFARAATESSWTEMEHKRGEQQAVLVILNARFPYAEVPRFDS